MSEQRIATLPLQGKRIVVTRTRSQASVFSEKLRTLGAIPIEFPTIRIVPPSDWMQLDAALKLLYAPMTTEEQSEGKNRYSWLVFTSANGVHICLERLLQLGYDPRAMQSIRVAAIGPATAHALAEYGINANLVPDEYIAESVAAALIEDVRRRGASLEGEHILLARAAEARKVLVTELQRVGAVVDEVPAYHTLAAASDDEQGQAIWHMLQAQQLDMATFTSSSTVRNFVEWLKSCEHVNGSSPMELLMHLTIACIGPITAQTARELGLHVDVEAKEFTIDGLVQAIIEHEEREWQTRR